MPVTLERGDITGSDADAIVSAANGSLLGDSGADGPRRRARAAPRVLRPRELRDR